MADKFGSKRDLAGVTNDEPWAVLEEDVHLPLARVSDLDFDEGRLGNRPRLG